MQLWANLTALVDDAGLWARDREAEGWHGVTCADHLWVEGSTPARPFPHLWVSCAAMAARTEQIGIGSAFANNLFRSPVEFAHACLQTHALSGGRFEAGLGAGWTKAEIVQTGREFPEPPERARRFREAALIAKELFSTGACRFAGEFYDVDVPCIGPLTYGPPPLALSLGGPWTIANLGPLADHIELKLGRSTHSGVLDFEALQQIGVDEVRRMVDAVRTVAPSTPLSVLVFASCGTPTALDRMRAMLGDGLYGQLVGEAARVADRLRSLGADLGLDRIQISEFLPGSQALLAPHLFG